MATEYPGGLRKRGGLLDYEDTIKPTPRNPFLGGVADLLDQAYKLPEMPRLGVPGLDFVAANRNRLMDMLDIGSVQKTAEAMAYGNRLGTGRGMTYQPLPETMGAAMAVAPMVAPAARMAGKGAMAAGRAGERLAERVVPQVMERGGLLSEMVGAMGQGTQSYAYRPTTPKKPDPSVGTRFEREFLGGLAPKNPVKIEDYKGASALLMPWDSTSRNYKIKSISDELLPTPIITHGGQDYARDISHLEQGIGGASGLSIAKRIRDRDAQARIENIMAGGTGEVLHLPTTMGAGAENFSVMPSEILMGLLDLKTPSISAINQIDDSIRSYKVPKKIGGKYTTVQPFKNFKGIMSEQGRMQMYTGEGIDSTPGELRKAVTDRLTLKGNRANNQRLLGFNAEDMVNAITDESLVGVPKGYIGNTVLLTNPAEAMKLRPSINPSYNTDFTADYQGTFGNNFPAEILFKDKFSQLTSEFANKPGDKRNMVLGALEKRKEGVSQIIDQQVIDNYYDYLKKQQGLLN